MIPAATLKLGKTTHKLRLTTGALMRFEEDNGGKAFDVLLQDLISGTGGIKPLVSVLCAGLDDGHGVSKDDAVAVIDAAGGPRKVVGFISEAIGKAFPPPDDEAEEAGTDEAGKASAPAKGQAGA